MAPRGECPRRHQRSRAPERDGDPAHPPGARRGGLSRRAGRPDAPSLAGGRAGPGPAGGGPRGSRRRPPGRHEDRAARRRVARCALDGHVRRVRRNRPLAGSGRNPGAVAPRSAPRRGGVGGASPRQRPDLRVRHARRPRLREPLPRGSFPHRSRVLCRPPRRGQGSTAHDRRAAGAAGGRAVVGPGASGSAAVGRCLAAARAENVAARVGAPPPRHGGDGARFRAGADGGGPPGARALRVRVRRAGTALSGGHGLPPARAPDPPLSLRTPVLHRGRPGTGGDRSRHRPSPARARRDRMPSHHGSSRLARRALRLRASRGCGRRAGS